MNEGSVTVSPRCAVVKLSVNRPPFLGLRSFIVASMKIHTVFFKIRKLSEFSNIENISF